MSGCVDAAPVCPGPFWKSFKQQNKIEHVTRQFDLLLRAYQRQADFVATAAQHRCEIQDAFVQIKAVVDEIQRDALVDYDGKIEAVCKQLDVNIASAEVYTNQAAVVESAAQQPLGDPSDRTASVSVPHFVHVPLHVLKAVVTACWCYAVSSSQSWLPETCAYPQPVLNEYSACIKHVGTLQSQLMQLRKMSETLNDALQHAKEEASAQRDDLVERISLVTRWKGKLNKTYKFGFDISGLAVNKDASLFAVTDCPGNSVTVCQLPSGDTIAKFGDLGSGPGQFNGPYRLCFTPSGTLLIADSQNKRVQELSTTGNHVRSLQSHAITSQVAHVVCNADVVQNARSGTFCVFDMLTGEFLHRFSVPSVISMGRLHDTALSHDGTRLLLPNAPFRVYATEVRGQFKGCSPSLPFEVCSVAELPDGHMVGIDTHQFRLVVLPKLEYDNSGETRALRPTAATVAFVDDTICGASWTLQVRYANGGVFVSKGCGVYFFQN